MRIATSATILRFQGGTSDKVWVMCPGQGHNRGHDVFWGPTRWSGNASGNLQSKTVSGSAEARIGKKLKEGYEVWHGVNFDLDSFRVVHGEAKPIPEPAPKSDPNFWYRIDPAISTVELSSFLDDICLGLGEYETESGTSGLVDQFNALSLTADLRAGKYAGTSKYSESPMAALVLFSLRRAYRSRVLVSDDDNEMLPDRFDDLDNFLCNEHLFGKMTMTWQARAFRKIGIAMQCIDRPIDLTKIKTDAPAAFF